MSNSFQLPIVVEEGDITPPPSPEPAVAQANRSVTQDHLARRATRPLPVATPPSRPPTRARDPPPSGVRPMARLVSIHPFFIKKK